MIPECEADEESCRTIELRCVPSNFWRCLLAHGSSLEHNQYLAAGRKLHVPSHACKEPAARCSIRKIFMPISNPFRVKLHRCLAKPYDPKSVRYEVSRLM